MRGTCRCCARRAARRTTHDAHAALARACIPRAPRRPATTHPPPPFAPTGAAPLLEFYVAPDVGAGAPAQLRVLLRGSLKKFLRAQGLSAEATLTLEYAPALQPPARAPEPPRADDWISAVAGCEGVVAAGLYNGQVQLHAAASLRRGGGASGAGPSVTLHAHAGAVSAAHAIDVAAGGGGSSSSSSSSSCALLVTAGRDGVARLWRVDLGGAGGAAPGAVVATPLATLACGACDALTSVAIDPTGRFVAAGDGRGGLFLWSAAAASSRNVCGGGGAGGGEDAAPKSSKRARPAPGALPPPPTRQPLLALPGAHAGMGPVTGVAWGGDGGATLLSCGWGDAAVRVWGVAGGDGEAEQDAVGADAAGAGAAGPAAGGAASGARFTLTLQRLVPMPASQAPHALAASPSGSQFATAHGDGCVRVWSALETDEAGGSGGGGKAASGPRALLTLPATTSTTTTSGGTTTWMSGLAWCPGSGHLLAGCSHSGSVALWDLRAPPHPLHALHSHHAAGAGAGAGGAGQQPQPAKALCVAWAGSRTTGAGGGVSGGGGALDGLLVVSGGADNQLRASRFGPPSA